MNERVEILDYAKVAGVNCKTVSEFETQRSSEGWTKQLATTFCKSMNC
jgi:DNA-binding XRE family transcriptional regulator